MSPRFVLGRENVPCVAEVVNRSLKADCTDFIMFHYFEGDLRYDYLIFNFANDLFLMVYSKTPI